MNYKKKFAVAFAVIVQCCCIQAQVQWNRLAWGSTEIVAGLVIEGLFIGVIDKKADPTMLYETLSTIKSPLLWGAGLVGGGLVAHGIHNIYSALKNDGSSKNGEPLSLAAETNKDKQDNPDEKLRGLKR